MHCLGFALDLPWICLAYALDSSVKSIVQGTLPWICLAYALDLPTTPEYLLF